jgi:uncharacterized protein YjdB
MAWLGRGTALKGNLPRAGVELNVLSLLAGLVITSCGGSGPPKLQSISVTPQTASVPLGLSQQFKATGSYSDGSSQDLTTSVVWNTSNEPVATVKSSGLATGVGKGSANISATVGATSGTAFLTVGPAVSVSITPDSGSLAVDQTLQFTASVANTTNTAVTWSVDGVAGGNGTVGTISSSGLYQASATSGMHRITVTSQEDTTRNAQATVTVAYQGMLTYRNDDARTGQNLNETILTPANVNSKQFGKLTSYAVNGVINAQPLYAASVTIPGQGIHNVVYVATGHDSVYAFDADGKASKPLWHVSFINPSAGVTTVLGADVGNDGFPGGEFGITSTLVIDGVGGTLYVVSYTKENGAYVYRLHALDLVTGAEKFGGPVVIQASVPGTGEENNGQGHVPFDPQKHMQRPALLLLNGVIYIAFGTIAEIAPWHGWLLAYDATSLQQVATLNTTPNGYGASFWEGGCAPAADASGNIYVVTGNGTFDASAGGVDYGDSVLKLEPASRGVKSGSGLSVLDWFSPFNSQYLAEGDWDLGSGGTMLLPDQPGPHPHLLVVAGKEDVGGDKGRIYLLDRDNLGGFNAASDQVVQEVVGAIHSINVTTPAYWQGNLYFASYYDNLKMLALKNGLLSTSPVAVSPENFGYPGASPSVSANGPSNGIVWAIDASTSTSALNAGPAVLRAYDATNVSHEIYNSTQAGERDTLGPAVRFTVPTVMGGKVYVGTGTELDVLGLLSQ